MPVIATPSAIGAFPSETLNDIWVFPFGLVFDPAILEPSKLNYDLYIDTATTFETVNAIHLTKTSFDPRLIDFQDGQVGKAFVVRLPGRSSETVTWYWKLRINVRISDGATSSGWTFISDWTDIRSLVQPVRRTIEQTNAIFTRLADENAYAKEARSTNVYKMLEQAGRELDLLLLERDRTVTDLVIDTARDTALINNFSKLIGLSRSAAEASSHHRWKTNKLWKAFIDYPGTEQGMSEVIKAFLAEPPTLLDLTTTNGWILDQYLVGDPEHPEVQPAIVVYDRPSRGHSWLLNVFNSWGLVYDQTVLQNFINKMKPAHSESTIVFETQRHWSLRYNTLADWTKWSLGVGADRTSYPGTLRLDADAIVGSVGSPIIKIADNITGFGTFEFVSENFGVPPSGGEVQARTSADKITWSDYVTIVNGVEPFSNLPIDSYIQFIITLRRGSVSDPNPIVNSFTFSGTRT